METKSTTNLWLALPILAIIGGLFIPSWYIKIPLWIIALVILGFTLQHEIDMPSGNSQSNTLLLLFSMYIFGIAIAPFALIHLFINAIYNFSKKILCRLRSKIRATKKGTKDFFIPLLLDWSILVSALSYALIDDWKIAAPIHIQAVVLWGFSLYHTVKLIRKYRTDTCYLIINLPILIFSLGAVITIVMQPAWITLNWADLLIIIFFTFGLTGILIILGAVYCIKTLYKRYIK